MDILLNGRPVEELTTIAHRQVTQKADFRCYKVPVTIHMLGGVTQMQESQQQRKTLLRFLHDCKVMWFFITRAVLLSLWTMKCIPRARITLKYGLLAASVNVINIVTSQAGQGLYATYDKDNRKASQRKSDDTQQICVQ